MRILHFCVFKHFNPGIKTQLMAEKSAAKNILPDKHWKIAIFSEDIVECEMMHQPHLFLRGPLQKIANYVSLRVSAYLWLLRNQKHYDYVLIRYFPGDLLLWLTCLLMKTPYLTVHHTIESDEISLSSGITSKIQIALERLLGRSIRMKSVAMIGVTQEICDVQLNIISTNKNVYVYPNGIEYKNMVMGDQRQGGAEFLFVANYFAPWHGLDLLIESVKLSSKVFTIHVVGETNPADKVALEADSRFIVYGRKSQYEIAQIAEKCSLGLSSFALDRKGMTQAATLKVREYLMLGLPVYAGYQDVFPLSFKFFKKGDVSIDNILAYASEVEHASREDVALSARDYVDKSILLGGLYEWLSSLE